MSAPITLWLPTSQAVLALGCSGKHLKRQRDIAGGFLEAGVHYSLGPSRTSSITWNVDEIRAAFHRRGLQVRGDAAALQSSKPSGQRTANWLRTHGHSENEEFVVEMDAMATSIDAR